MFYVFVPGKQRGKGLDIDKGAEKNGRANDQCQYPFGAQGEGFADFTPEIAYQQIPVEVHMKNRCDHEDNTEPVMKTDPLMFR